MKTIIKNNLQNISIGNYPNKNINKNITNINSYAFKNNEFLFKKTDQSSSFEGKKNFLKRCHKLKKEKTLQTINNIKLNSKIRSLNSSTITKGNNKFLLFNYPYSPSLNKKDFNNSLNNLKRVNLKKNIYLLKDKKEKNNSNTISNIVNFKKISILLKKGLLEKKKLKNKTKNYNIKEDLKINNYFNENTLPNSIEGNGLNYSMTLISDKHKDNKFNINDSNNIKHYKNQFKAYNSLTNETITKDKFYSLKKQFYILLEENQLYKQKILLLEKENEKLKEEISSNNFYDLISRKNGINEIKKLNGELQKQNKYLKDEVNKLKKKVNDLTTFNKRNIFNEKILKEIPLEYFESFLSILGGLSIPSTERYIKKLEKENNDLSNELLKYKNLVLSKNN